MKYQSAIAQQLQSGSLPSWDDLERIVRSEPDGLVDVCRLIAARFRDDSRAEILGAAATLLSRCVKELNNANHVALAKVVAELLLASFRGVATDDDQVQMAIVEALVFQAGLSGQAGLVDETLEMYADALEIADASPAMAASGTTVPILIARSRVLAAASRPEEAIVTLEAAMDSLQRSTDCAPATLLRNAAVIAMSLIDRLCECDRLEDATLVESLFSRVAVRLGVALSSEHVKVAPGREALLADAVSEIANHGDVWRIVEDHGGVSPTDAARSGARLYTISDPWALGVLDHCGSAPEVAASVERAFADAFAMLAGPSDSEYRASLDLPRVDAVGRALDLGGPDLNSWLLAHGAEVHPSHHRSDIAKDAGRQEESRSVPPSMKANNGPTAVFVRQVVRVMSLYPIVRELLLSDLGRAAIRRREFRINAVFQIKYFSGWLNRIVELEVDVDQGPVALACLELARAVFLASGGHPSPTLFVRRTEMLAVWQNTDIDAWLDQHGVPRPRSIAVP